MDVKFFLNSSGLQMCIKWHSVEWINYVKKNFKRRIELHTTLHAFKKELREERMYFYMRVIQRCRVIHHHHHRRNVVCVTKKCFTNCNLYYMRGFFSFAKNFNQK